MPSYIIVVRRSLAGEPDTVPGTRLGRLVILRVVPCSATAASVIGPGVLTVSVISRHQ